MRPEVRDAMRAYEDTHFANPSALYIEAREAKAAMHAARAEVGQFLNCAHDHIVFTASGTEANNMAILGTFEKARNLAASSGIPGSAGPHFANPSFAKPHIISVATEHPSVREVLDEVVRRGGEVTLLQPQENGLITADQVMAAITPHTILVSVMYVNNEIGVIQPIRDIAQALQKYRKEKKVTYPLFHTDACQAALFYSLDVSTLGIDLLTLDGLKIGGPRGCGVLYVGGEVKNNNAPNSSLGGSLLPIIFGGGQEGGLRSGTEDVARMIGMATALTLAKTERKELSARLEQLRDYFIERILKEFPGAHLNGSAKHRAPNNVNVCFATEHGGLDAEYLVVALDTYGVAASYSSSCRTLKEDSSSYVVEALYKGTEKPDCAHSSLRFTLGRGTTKEEIDVAVEVLKKAVEQVNKK